ncbi:MAG: zinc metallopeptidase [Thomasclavelia sp.]|jgi:Zn-dependent membrane protease YugP|nr:zinc metallopeptidase [Thomasclavelia sp.]
MYFMYMNKYYMIGTIFVIIAAIIMMIAQGKVTSNYNRYSKVPVRSGMTGAMVARRILDSNGLNDIPVNAVRGRLTDHYDPRKRTINLSEGIYNNASIAAVAVAAHECGHAIQHATGYKPLTFRNAILPFCNIGQYLGWIAIVIGLIVGNTNFAWIGVILMCGILVFQIATLPVEFNASSRALVILSGEGYLQGGEISGAKNMLSAAALTYVAGLLSTLMSLLRIVLMVIGNDRN